jgi:ribosomal protein S18 acetylase RimI-like enzyme
VEGQIAIRAFEPRDEEAIVAIAVAAWAPIFCHYRERMGDGLFEAVHSNWQGEKERQVRAACRARSRATVCVAEVVGQVVGFCTFYPDRTPGVGEIGNNAVDPAWQGRGIAPQMYEYAMEQLRALGDVAVRVHTGGDPAHAPARRAYQKAGFGVGLPEVTYYRAL